MSHKWQNIDKGTVGWYRCSVCGLRWHFQDNVPNDRVVDCGDRLAHVACALAKKVTAMLHNADADTVEVRRLLADTIVQCDVDSPYTRDLDG